MLESARSSLWRFTLQYSFIFQLGLLSLIPGMANAQVTMLPLGDLPGGLFSSTPFGLSGDGLHAVGISQNLPGFSGPEAFRWSQQDGMVALGRPTGGASTAYAASTTAEFVVGSTDSATGISGVFWERNGNAHLIPDIPGGNNVSVAGDVSDTGVVVGYSQYATNSIGPLSQAIRWTVDGGLQPLGFLSDTDTNSVAYAISADGSVIAGRSNSGNWLWTEDKGMTFTVGSEFEAQAMTDDGSFLLGRQMLNINGNAQLHAVIWSESTGTIELDRSGYPVNAMLSRAIDATPKADVVVGLVSSVFFSPTPYIWFDQGDYGMSLSDYLLDHGLDLGSTGYSMLNIAGISDDGTRFLLETFNPDGNREAVLVIVPAPASASILTLGLIACRRRR